MTVGAKGVKSFVFPTDMNTTNTASIISLIFSQDKAQRDHGIALAKAIVANGKDAAQRDILEQVLAARAR